MLIMCISKISLVEPEKEWTIHNSFVVKQHDFNVRFAMRQYPDNEKAEA